MEKQSPALIDCFFLDSFFDCVARFQQLVSRSKFFFHTKVLRLNVQDSTLSCEFNTRSSGTKKAVLAPSRSSLSSCQNEAEKKKLDQHDEIKLVMERLGLFCSKGDEKVSYNEMSALFEETEPCLDEVKSAFCVFDQNNDGFIDENELRIVMGALDIQEGMTVAGCRNMIRDYDENGDGLIDFNEFVKVMEKSFC